MHQVLLRTRVRVDEHPEFEKTFGSEALFDAAQSSVDGYRVYDSGEDFLRELVQRALVRAGWPDERAAAFVGELAEERPDDFRRAVFDAMLWEFEEQLAPTSKDLERAIEYRPRRYASDVWERALESMEELPVQALAEELAPESFACPWPEGADRDLDDLVDVSWLDDLVREAEEDSWIGYRVGDGMSIDLELRASPALIQLLSLVVQVRGGFALREDAPLEQILAAAALAGVDADRILSPFRYWLKEFGQVLAQHVVPALVEVVNNRFAWTPVEGKYALEALQENGLLPREEAAAGRRGLCPV